MKKALSILLTVCMLFTCFLLTTSAAAPGDVDGDGTVSSADARLALRASVQLETLSKAAFLLADADGDGVITSADARIILRVSVRLDAIVDGKVVPYDTVEQSGVLRIGTFGLKGNFSPFFSETAEDQDIWWMTSVPLLGSDRLGAIVEKGITGGTVPYNGTEYAYPGLSDLTITANDDGSVWYDFVLRDGVTFSDGEPLTVDDVIFTMYVLSDPTYDGNSILFSLPIEGMEAYRKGMDTLANLIFNAGRDNKDFTFFTQAQQKDFWENYDYSLAVLVQDIVDFCIDSGFAVDVAGAANAWGFGGAADAEEFAAMLSDAYGANVAGMINTEAATITLDDCFPNFGDYSSVGIRYGNSADRITGIQKTGKNSLRVVLTEYSAAAIAQLSVFVAPLHYYGDKAMYDYDNNRFGFPKGDLSSVRARTHQPMGAGPYVFEKYENGVVSFTANEHYFLGAPKTKSIQFVENESSVDSILEGRVDVCSPSFASDAAEAIRHANSSGALTGDKLMTVTIDNMGYGYIGVSANAVNVGGEPGSEASKNLRKALATVIAVYRDVSIDAYFGDAAEVINYPISNTSWAAPQKSDPGYEKAFSRDVNSQPIYTAGMTQAEKEAAALQASLGFFQAAGYTVRNGKVTAAPDGAAMAYDVWVPADGVGDHPSFMMLTLASDALKTVGITLNVIDLTSSADLWTGIADEQVPMWCAAWSVSADPDMYQIYYSGVADGGEPGGSNYMYDIADAELDRLILDARASIDTAYRKQIYKKCLDIIIDWAVEIPVYQRQNAYVFSAERIKTSTVTPDITTYYGWLNDIAQIELA